MPVDETVYFANRSELKLLLIREGGKSIMKKIKSLTLILLATIVLAGCAGQKDRPDIVIELKPNKFSLSKIGQKFDLIFTNTTDEAIQIPADPPALEYFDGNGWIELQQNIQYVAKYNDTWIIQPGEKQIHESKSLSSWLSAYDFDYVPGKYRFRFGEWYGEFTLTE